MAGEPRRTIGWVRGAAGRSPWRTGPRRRAAGPLRAAGLTTIEAPDPRELSLDWQAWLDAHEAEELIKLAR